MIDSHAMPHSDAERMNAWAAQFNEYRGQLLTLAARSINPVLARRVAPEDVVQDTMIAACRSLDFFENNQEIPVYFKLRTILFQAIATMERRHLQCLKRDAYKEIEVTDDASLSEAKVNWNKFAASLTGPLTRVARADSYEILRQAIDTLSEYDRRILELRHFDGMANADCAKVLHIEPKAASIRYVRALQRLRVKLMELSEFQP